MQVQQEEEEENNEIESITHPRTNTLTQDDVNSAEAAVNAATAYASTGTNTNTGADATAAAVSVARAANAAAAAAIITQRADASTSQDEATTIPRDESHVSLYHSVSNSMDLPDPDQLNRMTDASTQTDMTGVEVTTRSRNRPKSADSSLDRSEPSRESVMITIEPSDAAATSTGNVIAETSAVAAASTSTATVTTNTNNTLDTTESRQRKRRRKRADLLRNQLRAKSESSVASSGCGGAEQDQLDGPSNTSIGPEHDDDIFTMEMDLEDPDNEDGSSGDRPGLHIGSVARTVSMPIIETKKAMTEEWANTQYASTCHPFSDGDLTPIVR